MHIGHMFPDTLTKISNCWEGILELKNAVDRQKVKNGSKKTKEQY